MEQTAQRNPETDQRAGKRAKERSDQAPDPEEQGVQDDVPVS